MSEELRLAIQIATVIVSLITLFLLLRANHNLSNIERRMDDREE